MRIHQTVWLATVFWLLAGCSHDDRRDLPRHDPAACVEHCQNRYQTCLTGSGSYADCAQGSRQNTCDTLTNPELRGACQTSQAFCQNRSRSTVCGERLNSCMAGCN